MSNSTIIFTFVYPMVVTIILYDQTNQGNVRYANLKIFEVVESWFAEMVQ